ncbi:MAG: hypothetical protein IJG38_04705 [Thermoguttaceae bacterium]|nr:hypothetical protein [Thermoguttaceae bacterium]MBQ6615422.1 hypothetical protein [Thermoguttaceae bacterium]
MLNYLIAQTTKTEVPIPQPLQDAMHQITVWIFIGIIVIPILILLGLIIKSKIEQGLDKLLDRILKKKNPDKK